MLAKAFPLLAIVVQLFCMGFFMLGSLPLLVLKHDTPKDANFIRGLFNVYYVGLMVIAMIGAAGCAYFDRPDVAYAMVTLAAVVFGIRYWFISNMDRVRSVMPLGDAGAVKRFRRLHIAGMIVNVVQLVAVTWGMTRLATA